MLCMWLVSYVVKLLALILTTKIIDKAQSILMPKKNFIHIAIPSTHAAYQSNPVLALTHLDSSCYFDISSHCTRGGGNMVPVPTLNLQPHG